MTRQQKIRYPLLDLIYMSTAPAHHFALDNVRLEEEAVEVAEQRLRFLVTLVLEGRIGGFGFRGRERREA
jgi:hypothetical protein